MEARLMDVAGTRVTLANWQQPPFNRWAFQHVGQLVPSARVDRGDGPVLELPADSRDLSAVVVPLHDGTTTALASFLERTCTDGFIVLRHGAVVMERYDNGMTRRSRHLLESVSKSLCATVAGVLVERGNLDVAGLVTDYVHELRGSSFEGATLRHLLDMTAGTAFSEEYDDPASDVRVSERAAGWSPAMTEEDGDGLLAFIAGLGNARPHGEAFAYRSILTDVLGVVVERGGGAPLAELVAWHLWGPMGAESDAELTVDGLGTPLADGGFSVTLRDLARLGQVYLQGGCASGRQVVSAAWVNDTRWADAACRRTFLASPEAAESLCPPAEKACLPAGHYRNQWWVLDPERGVLLAAGIYGQYLYVDMTAGVVIAKLSTLPEPLDMDVSADTLAAFAGIVAALT